MKRKKATPARDKPRALAVRPQPAPAARVGRIGPPSPRAPSDYPQLIAVRTLFWHNVLREFLTSLSALGPRADGSAPQPRNDVGDVFDGRLAVLTQGGERIPIGRVTPLLACGLANGRLERALSMAVECTVFEIVTPDGESFTLPLHEIRGFHSLTAELVERIEKASRDHQDGPEMPFGFAAFTSLMRGNRADEPDDPAI